MQASLYSIAGMQMGSCLPKAFIGFALKGYKGETITDNRVFIQKTHHPLIMARPRFPCTFSKAIVLLRNPIDAFVSEFNLYATMDPITNLTNEFHEEFPEAWAEHFKHSLKTY
mmetsp:Transcript_49104/g.36172  ORF Transcript_49104/g.36172 Transcript_49104/m.36172 type:complete len:113 (+) Transcript_49104:532-870(+)